MNKIEKNPLQRTLVSKLKKNRFKRGQLPKTQWTLVFCALASIASPAGSNGFMLLEQNATNLGMAYAGTASLAEDASTNFYNSAGLTRLCQEQIVLGGALAVPNTKLDVVKATATNGAYVGAGTVRPADTAYIPWMHYAKRISDRWMFGTSFISTFGSKTDYSTQSIARYTATKAKLITVDIAPSIAYQLFDCFSVGVGLDAVYADATLASQLNVLRAGGAPLPAVTTNDGFTYLTGSRWDWGFHAGVLYEFNDCTRIGANYRSRVEPTLKGTAITQVTTVNVPGAPGLSAITQQGARAKLKMPDTATISAYHAFNDCWALMADAQWIHWNTYDKLNIVLEDGTVSTTTNNYKNSYRLAIGGEYQFDPCLKLRMGTSYDKTPTQFPYRTIYIPDEDQIGVAIGGQYRLNKCLAFDFGYAHIFQDKAQIQQGPPTVAGGPPANPAPFQNIQGTVKRGIDVLGLQATWDLL